MSAKLPHRMDRRDLEPSSRLHQDQPRLQALLRRDIRGEVPRGQGASLRTGVRPALGSREADGAVHLACSEARVRELDERPFPGRCARRLHRGGLQSHGQSELAHVPSPDEKISQAEGTLERTPALRREARAHLVGSQRRGSEVRPAEDHRPSTSSRSCPLPFNRTPPRRLGRLRSLWHQLGDRWGRKWAGRSPDAGRVGGLSARPVPRVPRSIFLQTVGRRQESKKWQAP